MILSTQKLPSAFVPSNRNSQVSSEKTMLAPGDAYVPSTVSPWASAISGAIIGAGTGLLAANCPGVGGHIARGAVGVASGFAMNKGYSVALKDRGFSDYKAGGLYAGSIVGLGSALTAFSGAGPAASLTLGVFGAFSGAFAGYGLARSAQESA